MTINSLKIATCGKVSLPDDHTLTYNVCYLVAHKTLHLRITDNTTGGLFSPEWVSLAAILTSIEKRPKTDSNFNAKIFTNLFTSASANNAGFLAAALKAEGILVPYKESKRLHVLGDIKAFEKSLLPLIKDKVSLHDVVTERAAMKAKVQAENAQKLAANKATTPISK